MIHTGQTLEKMMSIQRIETQAAVLALRTDGIIRLTPHTSQAPISLDDARSLLAAIAELGDGERMPTLLDLRNYTGHRTNAEVRKHIAGENGREVFKAIAQLVNTVFSRYVGNFFIKVNRPVYPIQLFTDEEDAIAWLLTFQD